MSKGSLTPRDETPWEDVYIWAMDKHQHNVALWAILEYLGCTLQSRVVPGKGFAMRLQPNATRGEANP